jgi:methionyl-tRNA formyltransferase
MKPQLVFFGTAAFSVPALKRLLAADGPAEVLAVVTKPDAPAGRQRTPQPSAVKVVAEQHGLKILQPERLDEAFTQEIGSLNPDIGVVVAYGKIIPQAVIKVFPQGIINIHGSLLPRYRGPAPIEAALLNGDQMTGVTLMRIDAGMDTGPMLATAELPLAGTETRPELYDQLSRMGAELLASKLPEIIDGRLEPRPQPHKGVSVVPMIRKPDGEIDWRQPAAFIERQVRAFLGWPGSFTRLYDRDVTLTQTHLPVGELPSDTDTPPGTPVTHDGRLLVRCGEGWLEIDRLKPAGKAEMEARAFLRGLGNARPSSQAG